MRRLYECSVCRLGDLALDVVVRLERRSRRGDTPATAHVGAAGKRPTSQRGRSPRREARDSSPSAGTTRREARAREGRGARRRAVSGRRGGPNGVVVSVGGRERRTVDDHRSRLCGRASRRGARRGWLRGLRRHPSLGLRAVRGPIDEAELRAAGAARAQGARSASTWRRPPESCRSGRPIPRLGEELEPDIVFATEDERGGARRPLPATGQVVKRGAAGVTSFRGRRAGRTPGGRRRPDRRRRRARCRLPRRRHRGWVSTPQPGVSERSGRCHDAARRLGCGAGGAGRAPAVVALETTIVAHGFPAGEGLAVGRECERRVRAGGAAPATVAVLDGALRIGLTDAELERVAEAGATARKVGPSDLGTCVVDRAIGATTVGATLVACRLTGISVMATGWHRRRPPRLTTRPDVSADSAELARTQRSSSARA